MKQSGAMRQAKYRSKIGHRAGGKSGKNSKWDTAQFIALDGEGESIGDTQIFRVAGGLRDYAAKEHRYTLLAASSGESLYSKGERLESQECIDFLLDLSDSHRKAIFVIFAGSYDINHILMFGFKRDALTCISKGLREQTEEGEPEQYGAYRYEDEFGTRYEIEYRARKSLTLRRGLSFHTDKKGNFKVKWASKITVWDVFGFFQENFVGVIKKWLGENHRHYDLIKTMKARRGDFANVAQSEINSYNAAELETLVELMNKVREAISGLGLKCSRWDGAGAVAAALMKKHKIKQFKADTSPEMLEWVRTSYAGGRIEVCKIGHHAAPVYDYDLNSAYPSVMLDLPCLAHGVWIEGEGDPPPGFTMVHCRYEFDYGQRFYPLFYRTKKMQISFPAKGEGIYWYPEYEAALRCPGKIEVLRWRHFKPQCSHKPFYWIEDYYNTRKQWVKNPTAEWQGGGEKIIKLGLNSLYGKTAQQLGGRDDRAPAYHQMEWAGYITSATRARLYTAGLLLPESVIGFATDGIFTKGSLPLDDDFKKTIGAWDLKIFDGLTLAMAGVYWWHDKQDFKHFSRGFDKDAMQRPDTVLSTWRDGKKSLDVIMHRLIGMGSACASDTFWDMRGRFTDGMRTLELTGKSFKRSGIDVKKNKPHKHLVDTAPAFNFIYEQGLQKCSYPYPLAWMQTEDYKNELEIEKENVDTDNI